MELTADKKEENLVAFFAALCLFLSTIEYAIPKPLPFLRLGLANLPILLALPILKIRQISLIVLLKILGQALISGTLFSYVFLFSVAGSFASAVGMIILYYLFGKNKLISFVGLSLIGSIFNNFAQIFVAHFILFGDGSRLIAPVLLCSGTISGFILGVFAEYFVKESNWYALISKQEAEELK